MNKNTAGSLTAPHVDRVERLRSSTERFVALLIAVVVFSAVALIGSIGLAPKASATTIAQCVASDAVAYQAAVETTYKTAPNPDYVPAVEEVSHVVHHDAVTHVEYFWVSWNWGTQSFSDTQWAVNDPGLWWYPDSTPQKSRVVVDTEAWDEKVVDVAYVPAIGEPTMQVVDVPGTPEVLAQDAVVCEVGLYIYKKVDPNAPASWVNSGAQTFIDSKTGTAWFDSIESLPTFVCGDGWGYQQDATKSNAPVDFAGAVIEYPNFTIGWPPIYADKHGELSDLIEVPDCIPDQPEPTSVPHSTTVVDCEADTVTTTTWTTVTPKVWNAESWSWVDGEPYDIDLNVDIVDADNIQCPVLVVPKVITTDPCGADNATITGVTDDGVVWSEVTKGKDGVLTISATPAEGYTFGEAETEFTTKDSGTACPVVVEPPTKNPPLADTGVAEGLGKIAGLALFALVSGVALLRRARA